jgi:ubiquinone/menaquinone biosynthesis C-methylase UbiE
MNETWDKLFKKRDWGKYPPEDLIRFIKRLKKNTKIKKKLKILELGCGPGANLNFLKNENLDIYGIDISKTAINKSRKILNLKTNENKKFKVGDFSNLPWQNIFFDCVIDNFSVYANTNKVIKKTYFEVHRVLKKNGSFFSKVWGTKTLGYKNGKKVEKGTYNKIKFGPCKNMGISHFFEYSELKRLNNIFNYNQIDRNYYTDKYLGKNYFAEIFISISKK